MGSRKITGTCTDEGVLLTAGESPALFKEKEIWIEMLDHIGFNAPQGWIDELMKYYSITRKEV